MHELQVYIYLIIIQSNYTTGASPNKCQKIIQVTYKLHLGKTQGNC